ncbi:MAG: MEDS domain-containing protein [Halanaerobiales bacterium]|nr:MEDS domain-containing protein [Halanaerobiales bacterium]
MSANKLQKQFLKFNFGAHLIFIYKEKENYLKVVSDFILSSIENDEKCIYVSDDYLDKEVKEKLQESTNYLEELIDKNQLLFLTKDQLYENEFNEKKIIDNFIKEAKKSLKEGYKGLSVTGDISWILKQKNNKKKIINYEKNIDKELFNKYPVKTLCRYNIENYDANLLRTVLEFHPYIVWGSNIYENPYYISPGSFSTINLNKNEIEEWLNNIKNYKKEKEQFRTEIEEEKDKFKFLFNQIDDALFVHGVNKNGFTNFEMINEQACDILGYSKEELLSMSPEQIDSQRFEKEFYEDIYKKLMQNKHVKFETEHVKNSGEVFPVENKSNLFEYNGRKLVLTIARDISRRVKKEKELENKYNEIKEKNKKLDNANIKLKNLIETITELSEYSLKDEKVFLKKLFENVFDIIPEAELGSLYKYCDKTVNFIETRGHDLKTLNNLTIKLGDFKKVEGCQIFKNINHDLFEKYRMEGNQRIEQNIVPAKETMKFNITSEDEIIGGISLDISSDSNKTFSQSSFEIFNAFYNIAQSFYKIQDYNKLRGEFTKELALSMIHMLEFHDKYTIGHSENVAIIASDFAEYLNIDDEVISRIYWAGLVHDIGKILIPTSILNKNGKLTEKEYNIIKEHPKWAYETLKKSSQLSDIAEFVLYHHENWDGSGYPNGLSGSEIPLFSQIISIADCWDAMRSNRSYRDALSYNEAVSELQRGKDTQHKEEIVNKFIKMLNSKTDTIFSHK